MSRKRVIGIGLVLIVGGVLGLKAWTLWGGDAWGSDAEFEALLATVKPEPVPPLSPSENWASLFAGEPEWNVPPRNRPTRSGWSRRHPPPEQDPAVILASPDAKRALAIAREARRFPAVQDHADPSGTVLPFRILSLSRALEAQIEVALANGDGPTAREAWKDWSHIAETAWTSGNFARTSFTSDGEERIELTLLDAILDDQVPGPLLLELARESMPNRGPGLIRVYRLQFEKFARDVLQRGEKWSSDHEPMPGLEWLTEPLENGRYRRMDTLRRSVEMLQLHEAFLRGEGEPMEANRAAIEAKYGDLPRDPDPRWGELGLLWYRLNVRLAPNAKGIVLSDNASGSIQRRLYFSETGAFRRIAAACMLARRRDGKYPKRLDELVISGLMPAVPTDPDSGLPIAYDPAAKRVFVARDPKSKFYRPIEIRLP